MSNETDNKSLKIPDELVAALMKGGQQKQTKRSILDRYGGMLQVAEILLVNSREAEVELVRTREQLAAVNTELEDTKIKLTSVTEANNTLERRITEASAKINRYEEPLEKAQLAPLKEGN